MKSNNKYCCHLAGSFLAREDKGNTHIIPSRHIHRTLAITTLLLELAEQRIDIFFQDWFLFSQGLLRKPVR